MSGDSVFATDYAELYDTVYADKEYDAEIGSIMKLFERLTDGRGVSSILDLGCGTGTHALALAHRGFEVTGVDRAIGMLDRARQKAAEAGRELDFVRGDIRQLELGRTFDAAIMMFAVLGYQASDEDALAALRSIRRHLPSGAPFVFDFWYGPAVVHLKPAPRFRVLNGPYGTIVRGSTGDLDLRSQTCKVTIDLWQLQDDTVLNRVTETHVMRYFFDRELRLLLGLADFQLVDIFAHPAVDAPPTDSTWNALAVAQAV